MKSSYKKLAPYIRQVDARNKNLEVTRLEALAKKYGFYDDYIELVNLLGLCGDIFGSSNLMTMIWKKTNNRFDKNRKEKPLECGIRRTHEYIVVCFKDKKNTTLKPI